MATVRQLPGQRTVLVILDGFGVSSEKSNNAVYLAQTTRLDYLFAHYPHTLLEASGPAVGLPAGQIGNSEIGHVAMGCGCIIEQDITRINTAIKDGSFFENPSLILALKKAAQGERRIHLLGLVSDGGVHSHVAHLLALIRLCKQHHVQPLLHMITDGRDTPPQHAQRFIDEVQPPLQSAGGAIVTVMGRYYAMDRDHRWSRTKLAWQAIVCSRGDKHNSAAQAVSAAHANGIGDEFIRPAVLPGAYPLEQNAPFILFNFRNDRPRQLMHALTMRRFSSFRRGKAPLVEATTMTEVDGRLPCPIAFVPIRPEVTVGGVISAAGYRQFHCAETEKYPHVTFYFNGGIEKPLAGEDRVLIPSPKVATYDLHPQMNAAQVTAAVIHAIRDPKYAFIVVNFANTDMVGHTAVAKPLIKAVETVDFQTGRIVDAAHEYGWTVLVTADHGNCDEMLDLQTQQPNTQHTLNPVPCLIVGKCSGQLASGCSISSIAPTVLDLMGLEIPAEMEAQSVIMRDK